MKKIMLVFGVFLAMSLMSCGHSTTSTTGVNDTDTVAVDTVVSDTVTLDTVAE